ncbi:MAG: hypothetical protein OHK0032_07880 [Thermodesulfovibrionales bacterium]
MKRLIISVAVLSLLVAGATSWAQMGEKKDDIGMKMGEGQQMPCPCPMKEQMMSGGMMPMMKQMMGHGMMMQDMMKMMMDMMKIQEKIMMGVKPSEKKQMMKDMAQMKEKMQKMMSMRMGMMGMDDSQARLKCAEEWLKKAIDLHELHMKDPKTTTEASQMELMNQMKKAYECITGKGSETSVAPLKETESKEPKKAEPPKTEPHKH